MSGAVHKSSLLLVKSLWSIDLKKVTTKEFLRLKVNQCFHDKATTASEEKKKKEKKSVTRYLKEK